MITGANAICRKCKILIFTISSYCPNYKVEDNVIYLKNGMKLEDLIKASEEYNNKQ